MSGILAQPRRLAAFALHKVGMSLVGLRPELPLSALRNVVALLTTTLLGVAALLGLRRAWRMRAPMLRLPAVAAGLLGLELFAVLVLGPVGVRYWVAWRPVVWILAALGVSYAQASGAGAKAPPLST